MPPALSERTLVFLVGAVQFVNILDFTMVMPMGPDLAAGLGIATSHLGWIGGAYTAAAAVSGLAGSFFLERFDRRKALGWAMLGLVIGTALGAAAVDLWSLIAARIVAGMFGGPATSLAMAIIADVIPPQRRGRAMGSVMAAFSVASVLGVPAGLELARQGGWRLPFLAVAGLGLVVAALAVWRLPPLRLHMREGVHRRPQLLPLLRRREVQLTYLTTTILFMAGFMLIPNISAYVQHNLGYPREHLGLLYLFGGVVSFFTVRGTGRLVDRWGVTRIGTVGTALVIAVQYLAFCTERPWLAVPVWFTVYFLANGVRNVPYNTLLTLVPRPNERAAFLSLQSTFQHMAAAVGAFLSSMVLTELPDGRLRHVDHLAMVSMTLSVLAPLLFVLIEARVRSRNAASSLAISAQ
ncbi:MAG: MFS transporter [Myxococcota bacterium]